jgi:hypothetical protein
MEITPGMRGFSVSNSAKPVPEIARQVFKLEPNDGIFFIG